MADQLHWRRESTVLSATTFGTFLREFSPPEVCARQFFLQLGARFDKPDSMRFSGLSATDERMVRLKYLTKLRSLGLDESKVTDAGLEHLNRLDGLQYLGLRRTQVTEAGLKHLQGLKSLQLLEFGHTQVTDAGLEHLKGLAGLKTLYLDDTKVTDKDVRNLQQALPNCKISH